MTPKLLCKLDGSEVYSVIGYLSELSIYLDERGSKKAFCILEATEPAKAHWLLDLALKCQPVQIAVGEHVLSATAICETIKFAAESKFRLTLVLTKIVSP